METLTLEQVEAVRARIRRGRDLAAQRFRAAFELDPEPTRAWSVHLTIQAEAVLEMAQHVSLPPGLQIVYRMIDESSRLIQPAVVGHDSDAADADLAEGPERSFFPFFIIERSAEALFEYWMLVSELQASPSWSVTRLIATPAEYEEALRKMVQPQLVRALTAAFLPAAEIDEEGKGRLEATVWTRDREERVERRRILLDENQELHLHGRDLIAEGRGGVELR